MSRAEQEQQLIELSRGMSKSQLVGFVLHPASSPQLTPHSSDTGLLPSAASSLPRPLNPSEVQYEMTTGGGSVSSTQLSTAPPGDVFEGDIARISELNSVLLGLLSSFGNNLKAVSSDTARLQREVGGILEERAKEAARREKPAIKALETAQETLPEAFEQTFSQITELVLNLDRKVDGGLERSSLIEDRLRSLVEFREKTAGEVEEVRREVGQLASRLGSLIEPAQNPRTGRRPRRRRDPTDEASDRPGSASPRPAPSASASGSIAAVGEESERTADAFAAVSGGDHVGHRAASYADAEVGLPGQERTADVASPSRPVPPVTELKVGPSEAPSTVPEDASVLQSFRQAMQTLGFSSRAELRNSELRLEELPGHPLLRHMSRSLDLARSGDSEVDDHEELYRVTAALLSRIVQLESKLSERVEPELVAGSAAIAKADAGIAELSSAVNELGSKVDSLRGAVESLEHRLMVVAEERAPSPVASPVNSPVRAVRQREVFDPSTILANNLGRVRELWLRVCTELGHVLHAFHKVR